jgi:hypothetical protein
MAEEDGVLSVGSAGVEQGFEASGGAAKVVDGADGGRGYWHGDNFYVKDLDSKGFRGF